MESPERTIFHCDCDAFFASVEETFHPEYKNQPMAVAGDPENRHGIILAKNALAKRCGVKTAETIWSARQKCPGLLLAPPRHHTYGEFCRRVNLIYAQYTDRVEPFSIDESFLDLTGCLHLFGDAENPAALAHRIRKQVERELGVTISVGVSWNKAFAKLGSDRNKPNNICCITPANFTQTVWPLPVGEFFGVGKNTAESLRKWGILTIGDLARADALFLQRHLGKQGAQLHLCANGLDTSPVVPAGQGEAVKSVGNSITFKRDLTTQRDIRTGVLALADSVASRLRAQNLKCRTVQVTIKDAALKSIQRQKQCPHPTDLAAELTRTALELIAETWQPMRPIRLLCITAQNLLPADEATQQLSLFDAPGGDAQKNERLEQTMDHIREKYGNGSILPGAVVKNDLGI
ncbi:MAG: DNA polymerase IV [Oscillospiraceae bacterium]|jgi:DNA polymerase-4|nr:DNA polymerase IV [Oscillospiraceae bacterium]